MSLATRLSAFAQAVGADIKSLNGKIPYKGDWNAVTVYQKGDLVWYSNDLWLAIQTISGAGNYPDSDYPSVWRLVTEGMPIGGNIGQVLAKYGTNSFETEWIDPPSGGESAASTFSSATAASSAKGADTAIGNSWVTVPVGQLLIDPDVTAFSISGGVVTIRDSGWYHVSATVLSTTAAEHTLEVAIDKDATPSDGTIANNTGKGPYVRVNASGSFKALAGDKVYIHGWCPTGAPTITASVYNFSIERIGGPKGTKGDPGGTMGAFQQNVKPTASWAIPAATTTIPNMSVTLPEAGTYQVIFTADMEVYPANGYIVAYLARNGVPVPGLSAAVLQTYTTTITTRLPFNKQWLVTAAAGDVLTIQMSNGGSVSNNIGSTHTDMEVIRVGGPKGDKGDTGGNATVPIEAWRTVGAAGEPAFNAGYTVLDPIQFRKDPLGRVHIRGSFSTCGPNGNFAFTLPVGYRPPQRYRAVTIQNQLSAGSWEGQININADGTVAVYYTGPGSTAYVSLDQISFDTGTVTQMPTGPQGPKGDTGGNATIPLDTWHNVGAAGEPAFTNNWVAHSATPVPRFKKRPDGFVVLAGLIKNGTIGQAAFQLPVGYRPPVATGNVEFAVEAYAAFGAVYITPAGLVVPFLGNNGYFSLDGIEFDTGTVTEMPAGPVGPKGPKGDRGDSLTVPMEGWHTLNQPGEPVYQGAWGVGNQVIRYRKDLLGRVQITGAPTGGAVGTTIFTLPVGYRPFSSGYYDCLLGGGGAGYIFIDATNGHVDSGNLGPAGGWFNSISFDTGTVTQMPIGPQGPKGDTGGIDSYTTLNWNTAITPGFYRSTNDMMARTINGPGDTVNPPPQAGIVVVHEGGSLTQRVYDLYTQKGWTRHFRAGDTWSAWIPDLIKPDLWADLMVGAPNPVDGEERYFQNALMKSLGILWRFRYDATAPAGKPKWVFVGGQGMYDIHDGDNFANAANVWGDAGPQGPGFTIPLQGDYSVEFGGLVYSNIPGVYAGFDVAVNGVLSGRPVMHGNFGAGYTDYHDFSRTNRIDNCAQGALMKLMYYSNPAGGGFQKRYIKITPIRVVM